MRGSIGSGKKPALHSDWSLRFHRTDNPMLICYSKATDDLSNVIVVVVNLDFHHAQSGCVDLDLGALGFDSAHPYQAHDLLGDGRYLWDGSRNFVELSPQGLPAHIIQIRRNCALSAILTTSCDQCAATMRRRGD